MCPPFPPLQGVSVETLCRDLVWLIEEVLFRNKDVGFGGSLVHVVHHALTLLQPCLLLTNLPSRYTCVCVCVFLYM